MKRMKKVLALMLAAVMVMSMGMSVLADNLTETYSPDGDTATWYVETLTDGLDSDVSSVKNYYDGADTSSATLMMKVTTYEDGTVTTDMYTDGAVSSSSTSYLITVDNGASGYEYTAYQIFTGTLDDTGTVLSNVVFGSALTSEDQATVLDYYSSTDADKGGNILNGTNYEKSAAGLAAALADKEIDADDFAAYIATFTLTSTGVSTYNTSNYTITVTGAGYYLIENTAVSTAEGAAGYSSYILKVVKSTSVTPKNTTVPTGDKSVTDVNDSEADSTVADDDTADYDIGDDVPFTLTATMPESISEYTTYALTFHDTLSAGLDFNNNVTVKVGETTIPATYTSQDGNTVKNYTVTQETNDSCSFHVVFTDVLSLVNENGTEVTVSSGTVITVSYTARLNGTEGGYYETNKMHLTYSNNPNGEGTGTSTTDTVTVFYYSLTVNKTDGENSLAGAAFTLYKYVGTSVEGADDDGFIVVEAIKAGETTSFSFTGLDDGKYKLVETTTPDGYNSIDPVYFTITAEHTESGDTGSISSLTVIQTDSNWTSGTVSQTFNTSTSDGKITAEVVNYAGSPIPATGGIGTTIFYIAGAILVIGAGVILVTRRRMAGR